MSEPLTAEVEQLAQLLYEEQGQPLDGSNQMSVWRAMAVRLIGRGVSAVPQLTAERLAALTEDFLQQPKGFDSAFGQSASGLVREYAAWLLPRLTGAQP